MSYLTKFRIIALIVFFILFIQIIVSSYSPDEPQKTIVSLYYYNFSEPVIEKDGVYDSIKIHGLCDNGKLGMPSVPFKTANILMPPDSKIKNIEVTGGGKTELSSFYYVKPNQGVFPVFYDEPYNGSYGESYTDPYDFGINNKINKIFVLNETVYNSEKEFPGNLYSFGSIQSFRGYNMIILNLYPVQYTPKTGKIYYYKNLTLRVETETVSSVSSLFPLPDKASFSRFRGLEKDKMEILKMVDNGGSNSVNDLAGDYNSKTYNKFLPLSIPKSNESDESFDYVIITSSALNASNESWTFQNLSDWKNSKGVKTKIVAVEDIVSDPDYFCDGILGDGCGNGSQFNDTQAKIRNFIKDAYKTWGVTYVLLGGDDEIIPHRGFHCSIEGLLLPLEKTTDNDIPSDLYYGCLDGSFDYDNDSLYGEIGDGINGAEVDLFSEVYIGRAPVSSVQEVSNFVMKTISYESSDDSYLSKALMVGESLQTLPNGSTHWGGDSMDEIKDGSDKWGIYNPPFPSCFNVETLYDRNYRWQKSEITAKINSNQHIINNLGHANEAYFMRIGLSDADSLSNNKYFFGYSQGCNAGDYTKSDSIIEHLVVSNTHGAFAYIGNSRYGLADEKGTTNGPSQLYNRRFFDALFGKKITNLGRANQYSKESLAGLINLYEGGMRWVYYELNLLGDPETNIKINCSGSNQTKECKNLTVCKNQNHGCDFNKINDALGAVCRGYSVEVIDNETYNETVGIFNKNIALNCNGAKLTGSGSGTGIYILSSDNSRVENCTVKNYTYGIYIAHSSNLTLINNSMEENKYNFNIEILNWENYAQNIDTSNKVNGKALYYLVNENNKNIEDAGFAALISCKNISVSGSALKNSIYGIFILNTTDSKIINNNFTSNEYGIFADNSSNILITQNFIKDGRIGVKLKNSASINISDNTITNNTPDDGISLSSSSKNKIFNNTLSSNGNNGVILTASSENEISGNTITKNYDGIWLYLGSRNNSINLNKIFLNDYRGIGIERHSDYNNITSNNITLNNETGIYIFSDSNFNLIFNNKIENNTAYGIKIEGANSESSEIKENRICFNPADIHNEGANSSGEDNICDLSEGWNDTGTTGCSHKCKTIPGDSNGDGTVNIFDVIWAEKIAVGLPGPVFGNADADCDGNVNIIDVIWIERIAVGLPGKC